jgi:hypothetical protein
LRIRINGLSRILLATSLLTTGTLISSIYQPSATAGRAAHHSQWRALCVTESEGSTRYYIGGIYDDYTDASEVCKTHQRENPGHRARVVLR